MIKVMAFGTFDGVHEGHRQFLRQARKCGDYLIVVVAQDTSIQKLKNRRPRFPLSERMRAVIEEKIAHEVASGDATLGEWKIIKTHRPEVIALGYDQHALKSALEKSRHLFPYLKEIKVMSAHEPERYHSRLLRKREAR